MFVFFSLKKSLSNPKGVFQNFGKNKLLAYLKDVALLEPYAGRGRLETLFPLVLFRYVKPIVIGKIYFTPNSEASMQLMRGMNKTFEDLHSILQSVKSVLDARDNIYTELYNYFEQNSAGLAQCYTAIFAIFRPQCYTAIFRPSIALLFSAHTGIERFISRISPHLAR